MPASEEAGFALVGAAFVRLLRDKTGQYRDMQAIALDLADWLHLKIMTNAEAAAFMEQTGWVFDSDLQPGEELMPELAPVPEDDPEVPF